MLFREVRGQDLQEKTIHEKHQSHEKIKGIKKMNADIKTELF